MVIFTDTGSVTANFVLIILQQQVTPLPQVCLDFATASTENQTPTGAHRPQLSHFLTHQTLAPLPPHHLFLSSGSALQVDMGSVGTLVVRGAQRKCPHTFPVLQISTGLAALGPSQLLESRGAFLRLKFPIDSFCSSWMLLGSHEFSLLCCPDLIQIIFPLTYELELLKVSLSERVACGFFSFLF